MKYWNTFEPRKIHNFPRPKITTEVYAIMPVIMGQLIICNDGDGFYGVLHSDIKGNITFTSPKCGTDLEEAKNSIINEFIIHCRCILNLCEKQIEQLAD